MIYLLLKSAIIASLCDRGLGKKRCRCRIKVGEWVGGRESDDVGGKGNGMDMQLQTQTRSWELVLSCCVSGRLLWSLSLRPAGCPATTWHSAGELNKSLEHTQSSLRPPAQRQRLPSSHTYTLFDCGISTILTAEVAPLIQFMALNKGEKISGCYSKPSMWIH